MAQPNSDSGLSPDIAGSVALSFSRFHDTPMVAYSLGRDGTGSGSRPDSSALGWLHNFPHRSRKASFKQMGATDCAARKCVWVFIGR